MARWVRCALLFGGGGLAVNLAMLVLGLIGSDCSISGETIWAAAILEVGLAATAGFAATLRAGPNAQPVMAGFGSAALTSLSGPVFFGLALLHGLPQLCSEDLNGVAIFFLLLLLVFAVPFEVLAGALAGWLGGRAARLVERAMSGTVQPTKP